MIQVPLTRGFVALIDDADGPLVLAFKWHASKSANGWYARRYGYRDGKRVVIYLHRWLMDADENHEVDHRNRDSLDCRRDNLRLSTKSQNGANRRFVRGKSSYRGVWHSKGKWRASICVAGERMDLGTFDLESVAALAYDDAAVKHFGEFAETNFARTAIEMAPF